MFSSFSAKRNDKQKKEKFEQIEELCKNDSINDKSVLAMLKASYLEKRGNSLLREGNIDQAIIDFKEAIQLKPDYTLAHIALAGAYAEKGMPQQGLVILEKIPQSEDSKSLAFEFHFTMATLSLKVDDCYQAFNHAKKALEVVNNKERTALMEIAKQTSSDEEMCEFEQSNTQRVDILNEIIQKISDDAATQYKIGLRCIKGTGVDMDLTKAFDWFRKASDQGLSHAQQMLGVMYKNGQGVTQDYQKAREWYEKAAEQGQQVAQFNLGVMYFEGQGVEKDVDQAIKWYTKAGNQGFPNAVHNLILIYAKGMGIPQDEAKALQWYKIAKRLGLVDKKTEFQS